MGPASSNPLYLLEAFIAPVQMSITFATVVGDRVEELQVCSCLC